MLLPIVIALLALWGAAAVLAVSLCVVAGRSPEGPQAERRGPLFLVGQR